MEPQDADSSPQTAEGSNPAPAFQTKPAKPVHALVLDANAIINNEPSVSTLLSQAEELYTIPSVVTELRDEATRTRFETTLSPFLKLRTPRPESVQFITTFARKTGDLQVLSRPDIHLLALTYDLEVERNKGDWRLRKEPNQQRVNGKPAGTDSPATTESNHVETKEAQVHETASEQHAPTPELSTHQAPTEATGVSPEQSPDDVTEKLEDLNLETQNGEDATPAIDAEELGSEEDDDEGWITPSNIKKHQAKENAQGAPQPVQRVLQAALITGDMAMRNVALRINLNLLDNGLSRITFLKTWVLRCHGCWKVCRDMSKQFCPSCGQPTLTRVSCTTDSSGNFKLHLKKNYQYNNRGNVYSIPKPTHGTASGKSAKVKGGGKNGWGSELILAEDQREYTKKLEEERRTRYRDLMDDDYLPSILTGSRTSTGGKIKVGAGRNINAKKRR